MTDDLKERLRPPGRSVVSKCDDVDGKDLSNAPLTYERIWLQAGDAEVTWCQHSQDDEDVPYIRADFYAATIARITDLEARLATAEANVNRLREGEARLSLLLNETALARDAAEAGEDALAEILCPMADENPLPTCDCLGCRVAAALAAYEARRKG